ncbi:MAG TPA: N-acetyltransferase [Alphaproteobacteria bacterium]|nr:N-acetyltransferase [Alphaproteobacteria bacterium]
MPAGGGIVAVVGNGKGWFGKFRAAAAELGWANACLYGVSRALGCDRAAIGVHRYYFVAQPVAAGPLLPERRGKGFSVREVEASDPALRAMPLSEDVILYRRRQGAVCLGLFRDEAMVGCLWLCFGAYEEDEVRCRFRPLPESRAAWDFDVYLIPEMRSGIAFARLWDGGAAYLRERGIEWSVSRISAFNAMSLRSHGSLGARRLGSATFLRIGGWQLMLSGLRPYLHLSLNPAMRPTVALMTNPRTVER